MYEKYSGKPKKLKYLSGDHNCIRTAHTLESVMKFFRVAWAKVSKKKQEFESIQNQRKSIKKYPENYGSGMFDEVNIEMKMRRRVNDYEASKKKFPKGFKVSDERSGVGRGIFGKITGKSYRYGSVNFKDKGVLEEDVYNRGKISRRIGVVRYSER